MSTGIQRIIVVGIVVGSIGSVVGFWGRHQQLRMQYSALVTNNQFLQTQAKEIRREYQRVADALAGAQQKVGELTQALTDKDQELESTITRLSQEERIIQELQGKLASAQRQVGLLQGELSSSLDQRAPGEQAKAGVQLDRVIVTQAASTGLGLEGRVVSVYPDWKFVVIDLGWDVLKIGDVVSIYRNNEVVGKVRVERVQEQVSAATVLPEWNIQSVQVNDAVRLL